MESLIKELQGLISRQEYRVSVENLRVNDISIFLDVTGYLHSTFFSQLSDITRRHGKAWGVYPTPEGLVIITSK